MKCLSDCSSSFSARFASHVRVYDCFHDDTDSSTVLLQKNARGLFDDCSPVYVYVICRQQRASHTTKCLLAFRKHKNIKANICITGLESSRALASSEEKHQEKLFDLLKFLYSISCGDVRCWKRWVCAKSRSLGPMLFIFPPRAT